MQHVSGMKESLLVYVQTYMDARGMVLRRLLCQTPIKRLYYTINSEATTHEYDSERSERLSVGIRVNVSQAGKEASVPPQRQINHPTALRRVSNMPAPCHRAHLARPTSTSRPEGACSAARP